MKNFLKSINESILFNLLKASFMFAVIGYLLWNHVIHGTPHIALFDMFFFVALIVAGWILLVYIFLNLLK